MESRARRTGRPLNYEQQIRVSKMPQGGKESASAETRWRFEPFADVPGSQGL